MTITMISLSKLIPSAANVRKTGATAGIAELAASIKAHGLLQNLQVRPAESGKFEVVAGRRRLATLKRLARNKDIEKLVEIPCHMIEDGDAAEISLAENVMRLPIASCRSIRGFPRARRERHRAGRNRRTLRTQPCDRSTVAINRSNVQKSGGTR
jgi:ParB family chromosome partitioning protein